MWTNLRLIIFFSLWNTEIEAQSHLGLFFFRFHDTLCVCIIHKRGWKLFYGRFNTTPAHNCFFIFQVPIKTRCRFFWLLVITRWLIVTARILFLSLFMYSRNFEIEKGGAINVIEFAGSLLYVFFSQVFSCELSGTSRDCCVTWT